MKVGYVAALVLVN